MQRSVSNAAARRRPQRYAEKNPNSERDLAEAIEAELVIGAKQQQQKRRNSYVDEKSLGASSSTPIVFHPALRRQQLSGPGPRGFRDQNLANETATTDDDYEDSELKAAAHFAERRSDSLGCSDDDDESSNREHSWSDKKSGKRVMNARVDYDMIRANHDDDVSIVDDDQDEKEDRFHHQPNEIMENGGAAVFQSQKKSANPTSIPHDHQQEEWMRQQQHQQQQMTQNGFQHRQKQNFDERQHSARDQNVDFSPPNFGPPSNNHQYQEQHGKHFETPNANVQQQANMEKAPKMEKPVAQQRQSKTLTFAPQMPSNFDGRPPLPLDAKKLQQQQQHQQQQEKKRRFPIDNLSEAKKGKKVETVPETCRLHVLQWLENGTRRFLWHLGRRLTSVPTLTVVVPLMVCALSTIGIIVRRDSLRMETPFRTFYYPENESPPTSNANQQNSPSDFFNASNPRYYAFQRSTGGESGSEFSVILRTEDHNVLEEEVIDAYLRLHKKIEEIKVVNGQKIFKFSNLCRRTQSDSCQKDVVETLMNSGKTIKFHYPETVVPASLTKKADDKSTDKKDNNATTVFFIGNTFGGVETDQDGALAKAESLAMYFKLKPPAKTETKEVAATAGGGLDVLRTWDDEFQRVMRDEELAHSRGKAGSISWWSYGAFAAEVNQTFTKIYVYLAASLGVFALGCLASSFKGDSYRSKPGLGLAAAMTIFLVVGGGWCVEIGITGYVNPAIFPAFFFVAATALHFMVNTLQSWRKYCMIAMDPGERVRVILSWDSPCLLWCCLIVSISYVVAAAVVTMPFYRSVCQFVAASSFLIIFLVLLLFVGAMYISGRRELAGFKWFHCGKKINAEFPPPLIRRYHMRDVQLLQKKMRDEQAQPLRSLGEYAANVHARYVALLVFCIYLIFAAWGCSLAPIRVNERQYIRTSTNLHQFLDDYNQYYGRYDNYLILTFHDSIDYFDNRVRSTILDMLGWVETQEHVAERTDSWLREFSEFEKSSIYLINRDTFVPVVDLIFLKEGSPYQRFAADIAFGRYREQIIASRMYIELNSVGVQRQLEIVKALTAKAAEAGLPMSIRTPTLFLLQHDVQLASTTITAVATLIGIMALLTLLVFAQPYLTLLTVLTTCSVAVGTIGFTALWDVPVNALNAGAVLAGVAHSAALCISCCYQYGNSGDVTAVRRMAFTFQSWLPGAVWSSGVGLAAFAPLLFVECQIIQHLAKIILCHFISIVLHVSIFLPPCLVLLTTSVPNCCQLVKRMCEDSFCVCCSSDEDATSIYYIPTGGRPLDPVYVQQFYQLKFREDILPPPPPHPLPPPPVREMLMPPPPRGPPSSIGGSAARMPRPPSEQRCTSPPTMLDSRMHSARSSMQRQGYVQGPGQGQGYVQGQGQGYVQGGYGQGPNAAAKVYRYGSNNADFEEVMRGRTARAAMTKRHMSPNIADPAHRSRHVSPDAVSPRTRRRAATTSPLAEPRQRHNSEEIYHEPSDPDTMSMRTANTNTEMGRQSEGIRQATLNSSISQPGAAIDSGDEEGNGRQNKHKNAKPNYDTRIVEVDSATPGGPPKNKITYAKWSKEIPLDPFTTERVVAEKYTIEGDGATIDLPPDWKRFWIKGNLRRQALPGNGNPADMSGMVPPGDHHAPMHPRPQSMPMPMQGPGMQGQHFRHAPPNGFRHAPPGGDGPPMMMPPYGAPPPLPPRPPPYGLPRAQGPGAYRRQQQAHFRKTPAWMY